MESYIKLFERDLGKLVNELNSFCREENIWRTEGDINNSAGNLTLHLVGNLNHFIGGVIGKTGYVRKRELEFADKNVPSAELVELIRKTQIVVEKSLSNMDENLLKTNYPINVLGDKMTYEYFLIHLVAHLNYHLGQINYLRRLINK